MREMGVVVDIVYHGVDTRTFAPMDKLLAKSRVGVSGAFVVGCVAVNQQRKNLPALVRAFTDFARDKSDAMLYLHTRIDGYWDIEELVEHYGVNDKTRATLNLDPQRGVGDDILATIYNAFDVFVLPTMAEGFGLPLLESQSCGVPALATDFSSCSELLANPRLRLRVDRTIVMARNFEQAIVSEADIAAKLNWLYEDRAELARQSAKAREFISGFEWREMSTRFVQIVERLHERVVESWATGFHASSDRSNQEGARRSTGAAPAAGDDYRHQHRRDRPGHAAPGHHRRQRCRGRGSHRVQHRCWRCRAYQCEQFTAADNRNTDGGRYNPARLRRYSAR
jgi:hypothetical protein